MSTSTQVATVGPASAAVSRGEDHQVTARLLQKKWGPALSLDVPDLAKVARICEQSGMNAFFHLDVLGDKLYDNADFWREVLAADPRVLSFRQERIQFGSPEWEEFVGVEEDGVIAAAILTTIELSGRSIPIQEANYVTVDDPILGEWSEPEWFNKNQEGDAQALRARLEDEGHVVNVFTTKNGFGVKYKVRRPDWMALALKKARTTSARRAGKLATPRTHARVLLAMDQVKAISEAQDAGGAEATIRTPEDPYGTPAPVGQQVRGPSVISESNRKMLFGMASRRGLDSFELKDLIAKTLQKDTEEVSTSDLTLDEFVQVVEVLESIEEESVGESDGVQDAEIVQ